MGTEEGVFRLLNTLFPVLTSTPSKSLRALLFQKILSDLRSSNANTTNHRLNRDVQNVLYELVTSDRSSLKALWAVKITRELWKRQIWTEAKAVEIMKEASLADNEKVAIGGTRFFLGGDKEREELEDESSDEDAVDLGKVKHQMLINKKNKKKVRLMEQAVASVKRKEKKKKQPPTLNFSALHLLHDPQGFAEDLFSKHVQSTRSKLNLEKKLLVLQLISRLVGLHKLTIVSLYSYFQKYLTPRQPSVTSFLASLAQSTHSLVPPDVLEPLVQKIANEFVSEAAAAEVASAGLNAIREICVRQPLAMNDTLLQDLVMYRKSKDKGVVMAARGLLSLYREVGADMLKKKDRGKDAAMAIQKSTRTEQRFGDIPAGQIEGIELLEQWKEEERKSLREEKGLPSDNDDEVDEEDDGAWEVDEADSDDSGGWINVESDKDIEISDSGEESPDKIIKAEVQPSEKRSNLATTRILTPADLAKLHQLRLSASVSAHLSRQPQQDPTKGAKTQRPAARQQSTTHHPDDPLTADDITGLAALSRPKLTREEKVAHAKAGLADDEEHLRRKKGKEAKFRADKVEAGKSTTNREKARRKNVVMVAMSRKNKNFGKGGLMGKAKVLKTQAKMQKGKGGKGGRRGK